jgi:hypothetical protein
MRIGLLAGVALLLLTLPGVGAAPAEAQGLTLEQAKMAMDAAEKEARTNKWNLAILIVDAEGTPVALRRMDGASMKNYEIAMAKVRTRDERERCARGGGRAGCARGDGGHRHQAVRRLRSHQQSPDASADQERCSSTPSDWRASSGVSPNRLRHPPSVQAVDYHRAPRLRRAAAFWYFSLRARPSAVSGYGIPVRQVFGRPLSSRSRTPFWAVIVRRSP